MGAPAARVSELAKLWVQSGHRVTVLTGFPNHPTGVVHPQYRARFRRLVCRDDADGVKVVRTWLAPFPNRKPRERILNYASFWLSSSLTGAFLPRPDVIIATSPQLLVGLTGLWLGRVKGVPFVLEVRDLWPESLVASGVGGGDSTIIRVVGNLAAFLYRTCDHVVVVTDAFKDELVAKWGVSEDKISVVVNGVDTRLFSPNPTSETMERSLGLEGRFVVSYIGTLGLAHGLETVLRAASRMVKSYSDVLFLLVGEGADKERLVALARSLGLSNVRFMPQVPREEIPPVIRASDVCLVTLRKAQVFETVIPTKMLEFMSCARPVILSVGGQARTVLQEAGAGLPIEPEDAEALEQAVLRLYRDEGLRKALGEKGRRHIVENLSRERTAKIYSEVLEGIVEHRHRAKSMKEGPR